MSFVTIDRETIGWLVSGSLSHLWYSSADAGEVDGESGCCPRCCLPCGALKRLLDAGQLDDLAAVDVDGPYLWDDEQQRVDRDWLARAWQMTACHETTEDPERSTAQDHLHAFVHPDA